MFDGVAEEAMKVYASLFGDTEITQIERYGAGEHGAEGAVTRAAFVLAGQGCLCIDSPVTHDSSFPPSMSLFVDCEGEQELHAALVRLSSGGTVLMPLDNHGFSAKFGWVNDRFGVSW